MLAEGNAVFPTSYWESRQTAQAKLNFQTTEIRRDGPYPSSNEKTDVAEVYKSWQEGQMAGEGERQIRRKRNP